MDYSKLLQKIDTARKEGKTIGLVQGSWDLFHLGHLRYLLKAKEICDFLIVAMDSDEKIRKRKGNTRPIIPEDERKELIELLNIADEVVVKNVNEVKWGLIKTVRPDVLVAIKDNYSDEQIKQLEEICGRVAILPRQSESSTSDKIRKIMLSNMGHKIENIDENVEKAIQDIKERIDYSDNMPEPIHLLFQHLKESTDWVCPVAAACYLNGEWHFGVNTSDFNIPEYDIKNRTELYYNTTQHAEINLLKKLGDIEKLNVPIWTTLFPCDDCMKVLIDKGIKKIYYLEDHIDRNWSKRSHALAEKHGVKTIKILEEKEKTDDNEQQNIDFKNFKYIYPPNVRHQEQLDIMMELERNGQDPLDADIIEQEILFKTENWYVSKNRFPYEGVQHQFLIVANKPVLKTEDITPEMWEELQKIWENLIDTYNIPGGALCARFGDPAYSGASLKRFHVHLISPQEEYKTRFAIGGNKNLKKEFKINYIKDLNNVTNTFQYPNMGLVVAMGKNGEIGYKNGLIWRIKEDLNYFKNTTMNSYMIMGKNTYLSMPKNLEGRKYIVLSRDCNFELESPKIVHHNINETLSLVTQDKNSRFFVVGGAAIYKEFLPYLSTMHITQIEDTYPNADTYFPQFNKDDWDEIVGDLKQSEEGIKYRHTVLVKKR